MTVAGEIASLRASGEDLVAALLLLDALTERPAWHARAACRGYGTETFFSVAQEQATATCRRCPVRSECAEAGKGERYGAWGGTTEKERRRLRKAPG